MLLTPSAFDDDGNLWQMDVLIILGTSSSTKKLELDQKDNYSLGIGFSMTWVQQTSLQELYELPRSN